MGAAGRILIFITLAALLVRLGWGLSRSEDLSALPDQQEYGAIAHNLLAGKGFVFYDPDFRQEVYAFRAPGYPLFLTLGGGSLKVARVAQALLDTSTVLAAYLLARRWFSRGIACVAAALVAINPFLIYFSGLILSETLFTTLLAWGMVLLAYRWTLAGALVLSAGILVRPSGLVLPVGLAAVSLYMNRAGGEPYHLRYVARLGAVVVVVLAMLLPWAARNRAVLGQWVWTTTNGGISLYDGLNPAATGASDQSRIRARPELSRMNELERDEYLGQEARRFAADNPLRVLQLSAIKVARMWSPVPLSRQFGSVRLYLLAGLGFSVPFFLLVLAGMFSGGLPAWAKLYVLLPALYLTLIHATLSVGSLRYRVPAEPALAVVAAGAVQAWVARSKRD